MNKEQIELMEKIKDTFRDRVCVQAGSTDDKNDNGGCGNPYALTLQEINQILNEVAADPTSDTN